MEKLVFNFDPENAPYQTTLGSWQITGMTKDAYFSSRTSRSWSRSTLVYRVSLSAPLISLFCRLPPGQNSSRLTWAVSISSMSINSGSHSHWFELLPEFSALPLILFSCSCGCRSGVRLPGKTLFLRRRLGWRSGSSSRHHCTTILCVVWNRILIGTGESGNESWTGGTSLAVWFEPKSLISSSYSVIV